VRENRLLRLRWRVLETGSFGAPRQRSTLLRLALDPRVVYQKGSVAKNGWGRKKLGPDSSLGGNLEEVLHGFCCKEWVGTKKARTRLLVRQQP
jgi:hypothetical protein